MDAAVQEAKDQAELNELLIWASARGLLADAIELIARGADLSMRDKKGLAPAHYAAAQGHLDVLQYLATKGADLEVEDPQARTPLHYAALGSSVEVLRFLIRRSTWLDNADGADDTALHLAARRGWLPGLQLLLAARADHDVPNKRGLSALGEAVAAGHVAAAKALLDSGSNAAWRAGGYTLLHVAAGLGQVQGLQLLLQHPAATPLVNDAANGDGATPLHAAAMAGSGQCVQLLIKHGAAGGIAGSGGLLPWQVVKAATEDMQQELEKQLKAAAKGGGGTNSENAMAAARSNGAAGLTGSKTTAGKHINGGTAAVANNQQAAGQCPVAAYSAYFGSLPSSEQGRKLDGLARMAPAELAQLDFLSEAGKTAIAQVRRAQQLLACYRAVTALRSDEAFQEDASEHHVQAALQDMGLHNNIEKYKDDRQVMSVAAKLKKFHTVLRECGGVRMGLQDLLVKPGQHLTQLMEKDQQQVEHLTMATAAARAEAIAKVSGLPGRTTAGTAAQGEKHADAGSGTLDKSMPTARSSVSITEIEVADPQPLADVPTELDRLLDEHKQQQAATTAALLPDNMPLGQRMRYELINSFLQAVKIKAMVCVLWGIMWCLGLLPGQQDPTELEQRMQRLLQAQQQQAENTAVGQGMAAADRQEL
eukprot:gene3819-4077_t